MVLAQGHYFHSSTSMAMRMLTKGMEFAHFQSDWFVPQDCHPLIDAFATVALFAIAEQAY